MLGAVHEWLPHMLDRCRHTGMWLLCLLFWLHLLLRHCHVAAATSCTIMLQDQHKSMVKTENDPLAAENQLKQDLQVHF